jgi:hypothetical protein
MFNRKQSLMAPDILKKGVIENTTNKLTNRVMLKTMEALICNHNNLLAARNKASLDMEVRPK